jgi:excisionase family DNA binding protein
VAFRFFVDVLAELANGNAVTVAPVHAELTSQQAADLLNVSRPFLIKLLDDRVIPYRRVGNRRKILLNDLLDYRRRSETLRREIADELTREAQKIGLEY